MRRCCQMAAHRLQAPISRTDSDFFPSCCVYCCFAVQWLIVVMSLLLLSVFPSLLYSPSFKLRHRGTVWLTSLDFTHPLALVPQENDLIVFLEFCLSTFLCHDAVRETIKKRFVWFNENYKKNVRLSLMKTIKNVLPFWIKTIKKRFALWNENYKKKRFALLNETYKKTVRLSTTEY